MLTIKETDNQFFIGETPEEPLAQIKYERQEGFLSLTHTEVSSTLKGQGIGQKLVAYAVDYARKNKLKITPICPFAKKQLESNPEYHDVLFE